MSKQFPNARTRNSFKLATGLVGYVIPFRTLFRDFEFDIRISAANDERGAGDQANKLKVFISLIL